jgi:hypothetical protein
MKDSKEKRMDLINVRPIGTCKGLEPLSQCSFLHLSCLRNGNLSSLSFGKNKNNDCYQPTQSNSPIKLTCINNGFQPYKEKNSTMTLCQYKQVHGNVIIMYYLSLLKYIFDNFKVNV